MEKFVALMLLTLAPALAIFLAVFFVTGDWIIGAIFGLGLFGLGLDVCLRGK